MSFLSKLQKLAQEKNDTKKVTISLQLKKFIENACMKAAAKGCFSVDFIFDFETKNIIALGEKFSYENYDAIFITKILIDIILDLELSVENLLPKIICSWNAKKIDNMNKDVIKTLDEIIQDFVKLKIKEKDVNKEFHSGHYKIPSQIQKEFEKYREEFEKHKVALDENIFQDQIIEILQKLKKHIIDDLLRLKRKYEKRN